MYVDMTLLKTLVSKRSDEIEKIVHGTGYLPKTVAGVAMFLLDNEGDLELLSAKQKITYEKFIQPLLETPRR